jgi:hypothetical protein
MRSTRLKYLNGKIIKPPHIGAGAFIVSREETDRYERYAVEI